MAEVGWASLGIIPTFDKFGRELEQGTAKHMLAAGTTGGDKFGAAAGKSAGRRFGGAMKTAAKASLVGMAALTVGAIKLGKDSLAEAREAQKVGALTTSTIKATGRAAHVSAKQVGDLAGALSTKTGIDDEVIQSGANMLLTFKNVRNEQGKNNDIFNQSVGVLTDLSSAMGSEPKQAAIQLGKALNDPLKGITALSRVGVTFDEQQKKQIKRFVEAGDVAKAQKIILHELSSEFGGAAEAQATMGEKASVAWGNIKEGIGTALLPLVDDVEKAFLDKGVPAAEKFTTWLTDKGIPAARDFASEVKPLAKSLLPAMGDALTITRDALKTAAPAAKKMVDAFNNAPDWVKTLIVAGGASAVIGKKLNLFGGKNGGSGILSVFTKAKPMPVWVVNDWGGGGPGGGPGGGKPGGKPPGKFAKWGSRARTVGRFAWPIAAADAAYETAFGDLYGTLPAPDDPSRKKFGQRGAPVPGAFGAGIPGGGSRQTNAEKAAMVELGKKVDETREKYNTLHHDMTRQIKLAVDNTSVKRAQEEIRRLINLAETANSIDIRMQGARGAHNRKLLGDSYPSGVTVNIGEVRAHDYNDFTKQARARAARAAGDGLR